MKKLVLFIILAISAQAYTLADYPSFFVQNGKFSAVYVIADEAPALDVVSATVISTALAKYPNVTTEIGTSRLDSEIANIKTENAIIIASPCESNAALALEGSPQPCHKNLGGSAGYIKLYENNGKTQLLITGLTAKDRNAAAKYLAQQPLSQLKVKTHVLPTGTNSAPPFFEQKNTTPVQNATKESNQANITQLPKNETVQKPAPKQVTPGEYEPLKEFPKKKGILERFFNWLKNLFT